MKTRVAIAAFIVLTMLVSEVRLQITDYHQHVVVDKNSTCYKNGCYYGGGGSGPCAMIIEGYSYQMYTGECRFFSGSGCRRTHGSFTTAEECLRACQGC
ncbi:hypothetical protein ElyMa_004115600 [Elysia marginata]|uniref:BPTI/Kunitz inhibitor domain-containing protein n=1 Tax=Elysia marginata TaxID=1093978 RepID=A0AAV4GDK9_9GAST|nr:hypothetical protein ElyMa_004115600 [Elysia marginata]